MTTVYGVRSEVWMNTHTKKRTERDIRKSVPTVFQDFGLSLVLRRQLANDLGQKRGLPNFKTR